MKKEHQHISIKKSAKHTKLVTVGLLAVTMYPNLAGAEQQSATTKINNDIQASASQDSQLTNTTQKDQVIGSTKLKTINVRDKKIKRQHTYGHDYVGAGRENVNVRDLSQTATVLNRQLIQDQDVNDLKTALRNVPGLTFQAGEGGQTEVPVLRGFQAGGDTYQDGVRTSLDFNQDNFDTESIQVLKGSSSMLFGRGGATGVINTISKQPVLDDFINIDTSVGSRKLPRITLDANHAFNDNMALRLNTMYDHTKGFRKPVESYSSGVAMDLLYRVNDDLKFEVGHKYTTNSGIPDYGIPYHLTNEQVKVVNDIDSSNTPYLIAPYKTYYYDIEGPWFALSKKFYGFDTDFENSTKNISHAQVDYQITDSLHLKNRLTVASNDYDSVGTAPRLKFKKGNVSIYRDPKIKRYNNKVLSNTTDLTWDFETGYFYHHLNFGLDFTLDNIYNYIDSLFKGRSGDQDSQSNAYVSIFNPNPYQQNDNSLTDTPLAQTSLKYFDLGLSVSDTSEWTPTFKTILGVRFDHIKNHATSQTWNEGGKKYNPEDVFEKTDNVFSYRSGLIYQPTLKQTYYVALNSSFNPASTRSTGLIPTLEARDLNAPPERTTTFEVGGKWLLFNDALLVNSSIFHTQRKNERLATLGYNSLFFNGKRHSVGWDTELAGRITPKWNVFAGFSLIKSRVDVSTNASSYLESNPDLPDRVPSNTPEITANLWTTYALPHNFTVGFGARYMGKRYTYLGFADSSHKNLSIFIQPIPAYTVADAMLSWENADYRLQLNINNLFNKKYVTSAHRRQVLLGDPLSFIVNFTVKF